SIIIISFYLLKIKVKNNFKKSMILYFILAVILFVSLGNNNLFLIESVLIFLFGMATGSLLFKKKNHFEIVLKNSIFLIVALALPFLFSYF
ncbi:MAG: hypothetical protein MJB14_12820, partial [Spirochaetes bacterium]|nr:hypothetical protein [Spirochaetota bacterium]